MQFQKLVMCSQSLFFPRPLQGPVQDTPLAVADAQSIDSKDLIPTKIAFPGRWGEIYTLTYK